LSQLLHELPHGICKVNHLITEDRQLLLNSALEHFQRDNESRLFVKYMQD